MFMDIDIDTSIDIDKYIESIKEAEYVLFCMNNEERRENSVFSFSLQEDRYIIAFLCATH